MIKNYPKPPATDKGLLEWSRKLYNALVGGEVLRQRDEDYYNVRHDTEEPPDPHPGMLWISDYSTTTVGGYCKVRLDTTAPTDTLPGMLWYYTASGEGSGTKLLKVRNETNDAWYSFLSTGSSGNDFCCYVSENTPTWTQAGMLWMDVDSGGMAADEAYDYLCKAAVSDDAPSPTEARTAWYDTP